MYFRGRLIVAVAAGVVVLSSGCGQAGDQTVTSGPPSLSESQFVARAEKVCTGEARAYAKIDGLFHRAEKNLNVPYSIAISEISTRTAEGLAMLEPPPSLLPLYRRYSWIEERVRMDDVTAVHAAHAVHAHEFAVALRRRARDQRKAERLARELGLRACSTKVSFE
jgi:hypothetical protein